MFSFAMITLYAWVGEASGDSGTQIKKGIFKNNLKIFSKIFNKNVNFSKNITIRLIQKVNRVSI